MRNEKAVDRLMNDPKVKNLGLKREVIAQILDSYSDYLLGELLDSGHIELLNGMNIEVVRLLDRVHVLRGVSYHSNRKYKLKLTMADKLYKSIESYYDNLQKEIE